MANKLISRALSGKVVYSDKAIKRADETGFVDINGHLTQQSEKLMNFFNMKSSKAN